MSLRGVVLLLLLAVCGYGATCLLLPRLDLDARQQYSMDRAAAVARTRELATGMGIDTSGWSEVVRTRNSIRMAFIKLRYPADPAAGLVAPAHYLVRLNNLRTGQRFSATFLSSGRLVGYNYQPRKGADALRDLAVVVEGGVTGAQGAHDAGRIAAEAAEKLAGEQWPLFKPLADFDTGKTAGAFSWSAATPALNLTIQASVRDDRVQALNIETALPPAVEREYNQYWGRRLRMIGNLTNLILWPSFLLIVIFYFTGLIRRNIPHRVTLIFFAAVLALLLAANYAGTASEDLRFSTFINTEKSYYWAELILPWVVFMLVTLLLSLSVYLCWAAGLAFSIRDPKRKTISMELLFKGKTWTRQVMRSIFTGLAAGGMIAAAPYLVAGTRLFANSHANFNDLGSLAASRHPVFASIATIQAEGILIVFGFIAPLLTYFLRRPMLEGLLIFLAAFLACLGERYSVGSMAPVMLTSAIEAGVLLAVYNRADLLATMTASAAATLGLASAALASQSFSSLAASGWRGLSAIAVLMAVSLAGTLRARQAGEEETAVPAHLLTTTAERERLKAEFEIARKAQQQMLPANPPHIAGVEISAVCIPSKDVGGDLYDFLHMPGGKVGIVVADVSGKGVPASLYMTLTKGLMTSVSENTADPGEILREVNRHLYEACRKRVFVTLFLGVLDPETLQFDYARAGHNPPVLHRSDTGEVSMLRPGGIGLGLNSGKTFDATLQVDSMPLRKGDKLFIYSDGITEAMNAKNEEYGEERLMELVTRLDGFNATDMRNAVMSNVGVFLGKVSPQDDQTLVVVKVL